MTSLSNAILKLSDATRALKDVALTDDERAELATILRRAAIIAWNAGQRANPWILKCQSPETSESSTI